jgi:hypothetical protein
MFDWAERIQPRAVAVRERQTRLGTTDRQVRATSWPGAHGAQVLRAHHAQPQRTRANCGTDDRPALAAINIFACEPEWGALAKELGGDKVNVYVATTARQDPHHIEARPSLIARARSADLVVCSGAELETGWLPLVQSQSGNAKIQTGQPGYFEARAVQLETWQSIVPRATIRGKQPARASRSARREVAAPAERMAQLSGRGCTIAHAARSSTGTIPSLGNRHALKGLDWSFITRI